MPATSMVATLHVAAMTDVGLAEAADPDEAFAALSNGTRVDILRALSEADDHTATFSELRDAVVVGLLTAPLAIAAALAVVALAVGSLARPGRTALSSRLRDGLVADRSEATETTPPAQGSR
ncbi:DUF7347 domain-containing protein [Haloarcula marina]|uniref:DUF7347 domain-containing protein n=1 Tax=Haloarcula marina TaxID=2961574 RepID=UPI0020B674A5|nr:hypothetical protein [Halomicroarcula marina]